MRHFVIATPNWKPHHHHARVLEKRGLLRLHAYAGRWIRPGVAKTRTALNPLIGGLSAAFMSYLPLRYKEAARFSLHPLFDRWVKRQLQPGDHLITSYGYANDSLLWVKEHGGLAILDAGNSHPANFWEIVSEEHRRWKIDQPPISHAHYRRSLETAEIADWVVGLSSYVTGSFIERGFPENRTFILPRPVDLKLFLPSPEPRPSARPLTLISTGGVNLRKGTPYLFEALRLIQKEVPDVRLQLNRGISPSMAPLLERYGDLPIDWFPQLDHRRLSAKLAQADIFILPTLEEGFARSVAEAMACGLPVVVTRNSGATDLIAEGGNGSVIPIRDPQAIRDAVLAWWDRIRRDDRPDAGQARERLSQESFEQGWENLLKLMAPDAAHKNIPSAG